MYEWDEGKRRKDLEKHRIGFIRAKEIWNGPVVEGPSRHTEHQEERIIAIGMPEHRCITVIYTWRGENRRLINARKARRHEQAHHENAIG